MVDQARLSFALTKRQRALEVGAFFGGRPLRCFDEPMLWFQRSDYP